MYRDINLKIFYNTYNIPIKYREFLREIILKHRLLRISFNKILLNVHKMKKFRQEIDELEILNVKNKH